VIQKLPPQQIPLGGGLRTDIDPKLLPLGNVLELENAIQRRTGEIVKRFGGDALPNNVNSTVVTSLTQPAWQLANYKADLIRIQRQGPSPISRWSPTSQSWAFCGWGDYSNTQPAIQSVLRGPFSSTVSQVSSLGSSTLTSDYASSGGYSFYAISEAIGAQVTHILQASDQASGKPVWRYAVTAGAGQVQRLAVVADYLVFAFVDTATNTITAVTVRISTLGNTNPTVTTTSGVGATTHATFPWFDMITFGSVVVMAWRTSTNKTFGAEFTPSTGTHVNYEIKTSASASIPPINTLGFLQNPGGYNGVALATCDNTGVGVQVNAGFTGGAGGVSAVTHTLDATPGTTVTNITGAITTASPTVECNVVYSLYNTGGSFGSASDYTRYAEFSGGSTFTGTWLRSARLVSKMFTLNGDNFVFTGYAGQSAAYTGQVNGSTQVIPAGQPPSTYFLHRVPTNMLGTPESPSALVTAPLARLMDLDANQGPTFWLPSVVVLGSQAMTALDRIVRYTVLASSTAIETQTWGVTLVANPQNLGPAVEAGDCLYVPGAQLNVFDGQNYADDGFAVFPCQPILTSTAGGAIPVNAKLNYCQVYRYTDAQGRVDRSAPSLPQTITLAGADQSVTVVGKCLSLTQRELAFGTKVEIETYRTGNIATGSPPLVFQLLRVDANDPTQDSFTFVDTTASVAAGQPLYTSGGVLQNDMAPGFSCLETFDSRIWGVSMDFPDTLWYTDQIADGGTSPRWSQSRTLVVQDEHGGITAIKKIDDKLIVFKKDAVYAVVGQGPDPTGANDSYQATLIALGIGTVNPQSVCLIGQGSAGVVFQSNSQRAGYFLLNRGESIDYIGAQVQAYNELATAAILVPGQSQLRFYTASGRTLVYDLVSQIWSTFTGQPAVHATCWGSTVAVYARAATADVVVENILGANYTEAGVAYGMRVVTPWIQLASLAGYERFFRIQGVGETVGAHVLRVRLYRDFDNAFPFTDQVVAPGPLWDWETRYSRKLSALKVALDESSLTAGPKMSALAMILGVKAGLKKLPSVNRTT
jgi:hypothetical protein